MTVRGTKDTLILKIRMAKSHCEAYLDFYNQILAGVLAGLIALCSLFSNAFGAYFTDKYLT